MPEYASEMPDLRYAQMAHLVAGTKMEPFKKNQRNNISLNDNLKIQYVGWY